MKVKDRPTESETDRVDRQSQRPTQSFSQHRQKEKQTGLAKSVTEVQNHFIVKYNYNYNIIIIRNIVNNNNIMQH